MSVTWIKMRTDLADDPAVIKISSELNVENDLAVGKLHRFWAWVDRHSLNGSLRDVTTAWIDSYVGIDGFAKALEKVDWLCVTRNGVRIPRFDRHNSQSAKRRADTARRVARHRGRKRNAGVTPGALPEKIRGEKKKTTSKKKGPTPWEIAQRCMANGTLDTEQFRDAWSRWTTYHRERRKPLVPSTVASQIKKLETFGHDQAIQAIQKSIDASWTGLFPPTVDRKDANSKGRTPPTRIREDIQPRVLNA